MFFRANDKSEITSHESISLFLTLTHFFGQWMTAETRNLEMFYKWLFRRMTSVVDCFLVNLWPASKHY